MPGGPRSGRPDVPSHFRKVASVRSGSGPFCRSLVVVVKVQRSHPSPARQSGLSDANLPGCPQRRLSPATTRLGRNRFMGSGDERRLGSWPISRTGKPSVNPPGRNKMLVYRLPFVSGAMGAGPRPGSRTRRRLPRRRFLSHPSPTVSGPDDRRGGTSRSRSAGRPDAATEMSPPLMATRVRESAGRSRWVTALPSASTIQRRSCRTGASSRLEATSTRPHDLIGYRWMDASARAIRPAFLKVRVPPRAYREPPAPPSGAPSSLRLAPE
jgi:hypothetical protein